MAAPLLAALFAFNAAIPVFADGAVLDFRALSPGSADRYAAAPAAPRGAAPPSDSGAGLRAKPMPARAQRDPACDSLPAALRERCRQAFLRDSLAEARREDSSRAARADSAGPETPSRGTVPGDAPRGNRGAAENEAGADTQSIVLGEPPAEGGDQNLRDVASADEEETRSWFANLFINLTDGDSKGDGPDLDDWAAFIFVVVGVVVVGAFLIYGIQTLAELAINRDGYPVFQEAGLRLSYSGHAWRDGAESDLYRNAYLAGLRYAVGFDRPGMDLGLAIEGGYIDIRLSPLEGPGDAFDFRGGYMVAGPMLRFGSFAPFCFSLEFLNGTATHASIGWISKSRMTLQARMGGHAVAGAHLGAVFYDLSFLDGLGWRKGDFNRDLSLVGGLDIGWEF